jgi:hypothetical protein
MLRTSAVDGGRARLRVPPWLFARSWAEARLAMRRALELPTVMRVWRTAVRRDAHRHLLAVRALLAHVLAKEATRHGPA